MVPCINSIIISLSIVSFYLQSTALQTQFKYPLHVTNWHASIANRHSIDIQRHDRQKEINCEEQKFEQLVLPQLSRQDYLNLQLNQKVQNQIRVGRQGYGWVCVDIKASPDRIFTVLQDFESYEKVIPTVRSARILSTFGNTTVAEFKLSRFRLPVNVVQVVDSKERVIRFYLDASRPNPAISNVDGYWHVEELMDRLGYSRVWLYANVVANPVLPDVVVDYAASRALPRATEWLRHYFL